MVDGAERERVKGRIANFVLHAELLSKIPRLSEKEEEFLIACLTNIVCEEMESQWTKLSTG